MKIFVALVSLFLVAPVQAQSTAPVAGKDYIEIPNSRPLEPVAGKVVVEEFFNYICPACNSFEPIFIAWVAKLPPYVQVQHVPASFRPDFVPYARAYYAARALGIAEKTHKSVYHAIHRNHALPAEGDKPDEERIAKFYAGFGVSQNEFLAAMRSFGVDARVRQATEHMQRIKVLGTPAIAINGLYLVRGTSFADTLRIATSLIESEHARQPAVGSSR